MTQTGATLPRRVALTGPPVEHIGPPVEVLALVAFHLRYGVALHERPPGEPNKTRSPGETTTSTEGNHDAPHH